MKWYDIEAVDRLYAHTWGESIHFGFYKTGSESVFQATQLAKRHLAVEAQIDRSCEVLEVASGWGAAARFLADRIGCRVVATNYSAHQARIAAQNCASFIAKGRILSAMADYHSLPFQAACFDIHWSQESLVHAKNKARVFAEAYRVLKPGGRIVFTDQTTDAAKLDPASQDRIIARHGSSDLWNAGDFLRGLEQAGFTIATYRNWTDHMARHFVRLYRKIEMDREVLETRIDAATLDHNHAMWRWGAELAHSGGIGYAMVVAVKPD